MNRKLIPAGAVAMLKRHPRLYQPARSARMAIGKVVSPRSFDGIPGRVHFNDFMLEANSPQAVEKYRSQALNVLAAQERALAAAGRDFSDIDSWLDFGCGYGRVVRFLVQRVQSASVTASDVIAEGVEFCASEFGVRPLHSTPRLAELELGTYDFVYAISVITHLAPPLDSDFIDLVGRSLNPGGIVLFTTHGRWSLEHLSFYGEEYEARRDELQRAVAAEGAGFIPYRHYGGNDYGMTWHTRGRIEELVRTAHGDSLTLLLHEPHGLDGHQDVFVYQRREGATKDSAAPAAIAKQ